MAGGFGTGFLQGLSAGADFARNYRDAEQTRRKEELAQWAAGEMAQGGDTGPGKPADAVQPAAAPAAAPAPGGTQSYLDAFNEATGPQAVEAQPFAPETYDKMPAQVANPVPGNGIGAGFAAVRQAAEAANPADTRAGEAQPLRPRPKAGAGMEALLHPERFTDDAPQMVKTGLASTGANGGLLEAGNIDLTKRPVVRNADGSISTVRSMSVNMDGREYLIPTVSDDGRILSNEDAIRQFERTGKHLGVFDSPENATVYAERLHDDQAQMYGAKEPAASAPAPTMAAAPAPAPAPAQAPAVAAAETPAAPRKFSIDDYYAKYAQKAASLGLADEANKAMAEVIARRYTNAAMNAYMNGNYDDIYRIYNLMPDGHSVKREVLPQNADGTGGGIRLTMVNDKTGQPYGQPRVFRDEREAAGAMMAATDPKMLVNWMVAQGKEDNQLMRLWLSDRQRNAEIERKRDADQQRNQTALLSAVGRLTGGGGGSSSGSRGSGGGAGAGGVAFKPNEFLETYVGKPDGATPAWAGPAYAYANQIVENNPQLAQSEGGRAMAATMAARVARAEAGEDVPLTGKANYRRLPILNANGTWDIGARDEDGNTYYLQRNVNPAGLVRRDKDGKAIGGIDDAWIKQQEVGFMQNYAKQNPDRFKELTAGASDPENIRKMAVLAQADPSKQADLRIMQMAQKYGANPATTTPPAGSTPAAPTAPRQMFTQGELQDAKALGVEPTVPLATRLGNAWDSVKSAVSGLGDLTPESFGRYVAQARRTGRFDADAHILMAAMQRNPALAKQLTPQELNAVQVAANKHL